MNINGIKDVDGNWIDARGFAWDQKMFSQLEVARVSPGFDGCYTAHAFRAVSSWEDLKSCGLVRDTGSYWRDEQGAMWSKRFVSRCEAGRLSLKGRRKNEYEREA